MSEPSESHGLSELSVAFCGNVGLIEARFLCIGWLNPTRMHSVACDVGLTAAAFAYEGHSLMFAYLGRAVEEDALDRISMNDCADEAAAACLLIDANEWLDECLKIRDACDGDCTDELEELGRAVIGFGGRRVQARAKLAEVARLLNGAPCTLDEVYRQGVPSRGFTPPRLQHSHVAGGRSA